MTDQPRDDHAAAHDDEVRRLLADARHDAPMPAAVVARFDRVLADLAEESTRSSLPRPVTSLATRRRRVTQLLVAAAAVVVVGVGVGEVLDVGGGGSDSSPMSTADRDTAADSDAGSADEGPAETEVEPGAAPEAQDNSAVRDGEVWRLQSSTFGEDALTASGAYGAQALLDGSLDRRTALVASCRAREWGKGAFVPVTYDGAPGVLVFRRPQGDTQVADLFLCGSREPLRSVTLPAP